MSKQVYVNVTVRVIFNVGDDAKIDEVVSDLNYNLESTTDGVSIVDTEITGYDITDDERGSASAPALNN